MSITEISIDEMLRETEAISTGKWVACVGEMFGKELFVVVVEGTAKITALFGAVGAGDEAESIANSKAFQHLPRLRQELIQKNERYGQAVEGRLTAEIKAKDLEDKLSAMRAEVVRREELEAILAKECYEAGYADCQTQTPSGWRLAWAECEGRAVAKAEVIRSERDKYRDAFLKTRTAVMLMLGPDDSTSLSERIENARNSSMSEHGLSLLEELAAILMETKELAECVEVVV